MQQPLAPVCMSLLAIPVDSAFSVFFLGATGYIGGSFLVALRAKYPNSRITALVRNPGNKQAVLDAGVQEVVIGTQQQLDVVAFPSCLLNLSHPPGRTC